MTLVGLLGAAAAAFSAPASAAGAAFSQCRIVMTGTLDPANLDDQLLPLSPIADENMDQIGHETSPLSLDDKLDALFAPADPLADERDAKVGAISSSELLNLDEAADLWPPTLTKDPDEKQMLWVDELSCIGCKFCTTVARATFTMADGDEDYGTARVTQQGGDLPEVVEEAIDCCPSDCIHFCSRRDLETL